MDLEQWLRENPPELRGIKAHTQGLQQLKALGYTQEQMRAWLATQGLTVSRQAISKFFLRSNATTAQPTAPRATERTTQATTGTTTCNSTKNPNAGHRPAPAESQTLKGRAQAVGDLYLQNTPSPLAAQLLNRKT